ncbi:MAG: M23 family metallopeptidase [Patescibacteria group bacterium]|jgi:murein DD-endopeptidase MepM/ murein hydrolase activator NlpD
MLFRILPIALIALVGLVWYGCTRDNPVQSVPPQNDQTNLIPDTLQSDDGRPGVQPMATSVGAQLYVKWPFGVSTNGWSGVDGDRTSTSPYHVGAEYYARDLVHPTYKSVAIYAGISGQVVRVYKSCANVASSCNGGYGNEVVIYDWNRHVAVRYAHFSFVALDINVGTWVSVGRYLGAMGTSGYSSTAHLHIVSFENINHFVGGWPVIPFPRDDIFYGCITRFYF